MSQCHGLQDQGSYNLDGHHTNYGGSDEDPRRSLVVSQWALEARLALGGADRSEGAQGTRDEGEGTGMVDQVVGRGQWDSVVYTAVAGPAEEDVRMGRVEVAIDCRMARTAAVELLVVDLLLLVDKAPAPARRPVSAPILV